MSQARIDWLTAANKHNSQKIRQKSEQLHKLEIEIETLKNQYTEIEEAISFLVQQRDGEINRHK